MNIAMHFNVQDRYFDLIKVGKKIAEGRIYKPKLRSLKAGEKISFSPNSDGSNIIFAEVTYVNNYKSFGDMLTRDESARLLPDVLDIDEAINIYESFGNYKDDQFIYGVVSIGFKLDSQS